MILVVCPAIGASGAPMGSGPMEGRAVNDVGMSPPARERARADRREPGLHHASRDASLGAGIASTLAFIQGAYYAAIGLWPLVDVEGFQTVTGPKADIWLVKTVGALVAAIGAALTSSGWRRRVSPEIAILAIGCALGLAAIDFSYVTAGRIPRIYLADGAAQVQFALAWVLALCAGGVKD